MENKIGNSAQSYPGFRDNQPGDKIRGKIRKVHPATFALPQDYRKQFGVIQKYIQADIALDNPEGISNILGAKAKVRLSTFF